MYQRHWGHWLVTCLLLPFAVFAQEPEEAQTVFQLAKLEIDPSLSVKSQYEKVDSFAIHNNGAIYDMADDTFMQVRLGLRARYEFKPTVFLKFAYEQDLISRRIDGGEQRQGDAFVRIDGTAPSADALRELNLEFRYSAVAISTGVTASNWGLGLLANAGRGDWTPGSAYFGAPYGGDRVFRTKLVIGPIPALNHTALLFAYDDVIEDDILVDDDTAKQIVTALVMQPGKPNTLGVYGAFRRQEHIDGRRTDVAAYDIHGRYTKKLDDQTTFSLEGEAALIVGETELGPNPTFPKHDVLQAGALIRTRLSQQRYGFIGDLLYASGDQNTDDDQINNFRVDPNLESGLILYRHVLNGTTGHAPIAASDPDIVGYPSQDLERLASNRSISNTVSFFPKVWWQFSNDVEVYGGALFAFSEVSLIDPYNSRLAGGENRNAFNESPGGYLGTEYDVGFRYTPTAGDLRMNFGAEFGHFVFGDAFAGQNRTTPSPINAIRLYVRSTL